jgi:hypothetical protein
MTRLKVEKLEATIIDPTETLERIVHCRRTGGKAFDGNGHEITKPEEFIAEYARDLLDQFKDLGVFNVAQHCVFDIESRKASYQDGFRASFEDVISKDRIVWVDAVLKRGYKDLHSATSGYILQRICAAAMLQKPKTAAKAANPNASRKLTVLKLPFPSVKDGLLYLPEAHMAAGVGVILSVRSSRVDRIDQEFTQFITGDVTTSGCILEYLLNRSGDGMKNARDLFWKEIRKIETMQKNGVDRGNILERISLVEHVASNLLRSANRVAERLQLEAMTIEELYPGNNFAGKWAANWTNSVNGLDGIMDRLSQERKQIEGLIQSETAAKTQKQAEAAQRSANVLTIVLAAATIIQSLSFIVEGGAISFPRIGVSIGILGGIAALFWRGLKHQSKIGNGNGENGNGHK